MSGVHKAYGPLAVVTGASDGIGRAFAVALAHQGFDLILVARRREMLQTLARELAQQHGVTATVVGADLTREADMDTVKTKCADQDVGLFVAAAGYGTAGGFLNVEATTELNMVELNCTSVLDLTHYFASRFATRGKGGIVLLSSLFAFQGVPRSATYAATKAFIQTLTEGLRPELARHNVDVIAAAPGPIHSGFAARANLRMGMGQSPDVVAKATLKKLGKRTTVRPGVLAKLLEASFTGLPRWARSKILGVVVKGMTDHQHEAKPANP